MSDDEDQQQMMGEQGEDDDNMVSLDDVATGFTLLPDSDDDDEEDDEENEEDENDTSEAAKKKKEEKKAKRKAAELARQVKFNADTTPLNPLTNPKRFKVNIDSDSFLELLEFGDLDLSGALVFEGFPSKGSTSVMVAKFMISEMKLPLIGVLDSSVFKPICRISHGLPTPAYCVYGNSKAVVFTSELGVELELAGPMATIILDFAQRHKCKTIFCAESYAEPIDAELSAEDVTSQEAVMNKLVSMMGATKVRADSEDAPTGTEDEEGWVDEPETPQPSSGAAAKKSRRKKHGKHGNKKRKQSEDAHQESEMAPEDIMYICTNDRLTVLLREHKYTRVKNGILGGVSGSLMIQAAFRQMDAVCLIAKYNPLLSDTRTGAGILHAIDELSGSFFNIDHKPLQKIADRVERRIRKAMLKMTSATKSPGPGGPMGMYV